MNIVKPVTQIVCLLALLVADSFADSSLICTASSSGESLTVTVKMPTPHPGEMVINTPDGRMIWLQADHIPFVHPISSDFVHLSEFELNKKTRGSWFNDWGEPEAVTLFSIDGSYEIVITDDAESGRKNADTLTCQFTVTMNGE